jgi:hypothetical protein
MKDLHRHSNNNNLLKKLLAFQLRLKQLLIYGLLIINKIPTSPQQPETEENEEDDEEESEKETPRLRPRGFDYYKKYTSSNQSTSQKNREEMMNIFRIAIVMKKIFHQMVEYLQKLDVICLFLNI